MDARHKLHEGIAFFNSGRFFDAHEALEDVWRELHGDQRRWMQGIIQVAVALHHHSTGNLVGAQSLLARASAKLTDAPDELLGISVPSLREALRAWHSALEEGTPPPPPPRLEMHRGR